MDIRTELISKLTSESQYKEMCLKISSRYGEDLYQEMCELILTIDTHRLPDLSFFNFWFYRVASNMVSKNGTIGKMDTAKYMEVTTSETTDEDLKKLEHIMLTLPEFDNRIIMLYKELGNMKAVQRETGISYSALRKVKENIKNIR